MKKAQASGNKNNNAWNSLTVKEITEWRNSTQGLKTNKQTQKLLLDIPLRENWYVE